MPSFWVMPSPIFGPGIFDAVSDDRPAVVQARLRLIQLVAAARAVFDGPQLALRIEGRGLDVAMAVRPDLRLRVAAADEGIVARHAAIRIEAHDLAEVTVQILRMHASFRQRALAERQEQFAIGREHDARAEVQFRIPRRHLAEDHLHLLDAAFVRRQHALGERRAVAAFARLGIAPVNRAIGGELRIECYVEQAALALEINLGQAFQRRGRPCRPCR